MAGRTVLFHPRISARPSAREWIGACFDRGLALDTLSLYARAMEDFLSFWERHDATTGPEGATRDDIVAYGYDLATRKPVLAPDSSRVAAR